MSASLTTGAAGPGETFPAGPRTKNTQGDVVTFAVTPERVDVVDGGRLRHRPVTTRVHPGDALARPAAIGLAALLPGTV